MCQAALAAEVRFFPADIKDESRKSVPLGASGLLAPEGIFLSAQKKI
jgi:hypothetical protein